VVAGGGISYSLASLKTSERGGWWRSNKFDYVKREE
jgi:hypothetical protein